MCSAVEAACMCQQLAPTTAYTASIGLFCVVYAIWFCLWRSDAATIKRVLISCRWRRGYWGGWFLAGRDMHGVLPFGSRPTLFGLLAHSRPSIGRGKIGAIASPSYLR